MYYEIIILKMKWSRMKPMINKNTNLHFFVLNTLNSKSSNKNYIFRVIIYNQ